MSAFPATAPADRTSRVVLLVSLALNLFIVGVAGAVAVRQFLPAAPATSPEASRSAAARIDRLAATLPASDADLLRGEFRAHESVVESANSVYRRAQDKVRAALRAEPFAIEAVRAAMTETRAARQGLDVVLQDVIASAAGRMSPAGRHKLAEWPPPRRP